MRVTKGTSALVVIALLAFTFPSLAHAQIQTGSIAGVVRDATGGVLPGVTVEAASPALIEKVMTVVSDSGGQYRIVNLRPGTYTVTFSLAGFGTVRREGITLNAGFTATINADLSVGALAETVTVSGASPVVDTQNIRTQNVITRQALDDLPTTKNFQGLQALTLGASGGGPQGGRETGGDRGESLFGLAIHGSVAGIPLMDGMTYGGTYGSVHRFAVNQLAVQEAVLETGGGIAQSDSGGLNVNIILKDGGNSFRASTEIEGTNRRFQASNLTDQLRQRGLVQPNRTKKIYESSFALGGPIKRDRLWFFTSHRWQGAQAEIAGVFFNKVQGTLFYEPDLSRPAYSDNHTRDNLLRLTWQASSKNKFTFLGDLQKWCWCYYYIDQSRVGFADQARGFHVPESTYDMDIDPNNVFQANWTYPATSRLLFEAGIGERDDRDVKRPVAETGTNARPVLELSTGIAYGSMFIGSAQWLDDYGDQYNNYALTTRASMSYITGSHALKVGFTNLSGDRPAGGKPLFNVGYVFRNRVPVEINQIAGPHYQLSKIKLGLGIYGQDQWTIRRLTLNLGVRFDQLNMYHPDQVRPAGEFTPEFRFSAIYDKPNWKDISPRFGAAYDLFGNGKTAIKGSFGKYVSITYGPAITTFTNPSRAIAGTTTRTWNDTNGDYVPNCDLTARTANGECGAMSNPAFGTPVPQIAFSNDIAEGWSKRPYTWQGSLVFQQELLPNVGLTVGYFRTSYRNFNVTDNLAVGPSDFDPYCVTAPRDPRLDGGGGYQVCGLYDIKPAKFGQVNNLVEQADKYGKQSQVFDGFDIGINSRFKNGATLAGGISTGRTAFDQCAVADVPGQFCEFQLPWAGQTQIKVNGTYPLPWGFQASGVVQNLAGVSRAATYVVTNADILPSLGRNLGRCGTAAVCNAALGVSIIEPNTLREPRSTQLDFRIARVFRFGQARITPRIDVYNAFNNSAVLRMNTTFGPNWLRPLDLIGGRLIKFGFRADF